MVSERDFCRSVSLFLSFCLSLCHSLSFSLNCSLSFSLSFFLFLSFSFRLPLILFQPRFLHPSSAPSCFLDLSLSLFLSLTLMHAHKNSLFLSFKSQENEKHLTFVTLFPLLLLCFALSLLSDKCGS